MGRSLAPLAAAVPIERYTEAASNPFSTPGFRYQIERRGKRSWHKETVIAQGRAVAETRAEVQFAVGSGHSGRAYLIDREGWLFSSPITWYPAQASASIRSPKPLVEMRPVIQQGAPQRRTDSGFP